MAATRPEIINGCPTPRFPTSYEYLGFAYEVQKVTRKNRGSLRFRVLPFEGELGYDSFRTHDEVRHNIQEGREVIFARTLGRRPRDVGVVTQEVKRVEIDGEAKRIGVIGVKAILPNYQGRGIGTHLAEDLIYRHRPHAITGRTRSWRVIRVYEDTGLIGPILPIDGVPTQEMQDVLPQVLNKAALKRLELTTGRYDGSHGDIYPKADRRFLVPDPSNKGAKRIYDKIIGPEIGANPEDGDGIRYYAKVDQEAVDFAIRSYNPREVVATSTRSLTVFRLISRVASIFLAISKLKR